MAGYIHVTQATRIPAEGGKLIEELFGRASTGGQDVSVAHMIAPPGWDEPAQTPEFAELTILIAGKLRVEIGEQLIELKAGEAVRVEPGVRVRYSNPFAEPSEYYAICLPAFSVDAAHRDP